MPSTVITLEMTAHFNPQSHEVNCARILMREEEIETQRGDGSKSPAYKNQSWNVNLGNPTTETKLLTIRLKGESHHSSLSFSPEVLSSRSFKGNL